MNPQPREHCHPRENKEKAGLSPPSRGTCGDFHLMFRLGGVFTFRQVEEIAFISEVEADSNRDQEPRGNESIEGGIGHSRLLVLGEEGSLAEYSVIHLFPARLNREAKRETRTTLTSYHYPVYFSTCRAALLSRGVLLFGQLAQFG